MASRPTGAPEVRITIRRGIRTSGHGPRAGERGECAGPVTVVPDTARVLRAPRVVGRELEYLAVQRSLAPGPSGRPGAVAVTGPAGVGKSALMRAVADAGTDLLVARAVPSTRSGLSPIVELAVGLVERGARHDEAALGVFRPAITALLPTLAAGRDADDLQAQVPHPVLLADGLLRLWATLAVPRRPALVLEDLHWAGEATWVVTARLLRQAAAVGAGLLVTSRPEGPWWAELHHAVRAGEVMGVQLSELSQPAVADLVAGCLAVPVGAVPAQVLAVVGAAGGLPLLVEEVVADLVRAGALARDADGWSWRPDGPVLPRTLADLTRERVAALSPELAAVMRRAAVLGTTPSLDLLAATAPGGPEQAAAAVTAGLEGGLLQLDEASGTVVFRHELVRDAVLADMRAPQRRAEATALLHAVVRIPAGAPADHLAGSAPGLDEADLALVARLADEAGLTEVGGTFYLALAQRQLRRGLPLAAAASADMAAGLLDPTAAVPAATPVTGLVEALVVQVQAFSLAGEVDRALAAADRLEVLSGHARAGVREAVARALSARGDWAQAETELAAVRGLKEPATVTALAALIALEQGRTQDAHDWAARALQTSAGPVAEAVDGPAQCQALEVLGRLARTHDLDEAQARFRRCALVAQAHGLTVWRARALHEDATIEQLRSLDVQALHQARQAAVEAGAPGLVGSVDFHLAAVYGVRFESSPALQFARGLLADARSQGAQRMQAWAWVLIGQGHAVGGHRAQAEAAAAEALSLAPGDSEIESVAVGTGRALPALLDDDQEVALQHWQVAVARLRALPVVVPLPPWYLWPVLATVADLDGDGGAMARAEARDPQLRLLPGVEAVRLLAEAVVAGRCADHAAAAAAAQDAHALFDRVPMFAGWRHLAHRWVAADAISAGWGDPASWMTEATDWFEARGFDRQAAGCRRLARQAGAPQRRRGRGDSRVPEHLHRLGITSREMDVLALVAAGMTNSQIADRLHLSPRTVKGYVEQLLAKTGASNRTQLVAHLPDRQGAHGAGSAGV